MKLALSVVLCSHGHLKQCLVFLRVVSVQHRCMPCRAAVPFPGCTRRASRRTHPRLRRRMRGVLHRQGTRTPGCKMCGCIHLLDAHGAQRIPRAQGRRLRKVHCVHGFVHSGCALGVVPLFTAGSLAADVLCFAATALFSRPCVLLSLAALRRLRGSGHRQPAIPIP